ncbi:MAG: hypothetical protein US98_C0055G0002 [Parcubacteria group bacterium GW2011_GWC1_38_6]|nr:MAG: hypothetical protein US98_C0055G0002 [Parcubacteria group bacterium GW2011_GWC1_38_6]
MATRKELIHGFRVVFDEEVLVSAVKYLRYDLQPNEAKTLFDAARLRGNAEFEDDQDRDWTLTYNRGDNTYTLFHRQKE